MKLAAEVRRLAEETGALKTQNRTIEQERGQLEGAVSSLRKENEKLKEQAVAQSALASQLKEEVERLRGGGVAAVKAVEEAAAAEAAARQTAAEAAARQAAAPAGLSADELRQEREKRIAEITKDISALETRKTNLRSQIGAGQAEVTAFAKASVDAQVMPPAGGYTEAPSRYHPDGQVYARQRWNAGSVTYPDWRERTFPVGPAIQRGDFRTQHDKDIAIAAAQKKLLPLFEELRPLEKELAQLKEELGKLNKEKIGEGKRIEKETIVVMVLKHKATGETIKGILTNQKVNNLRAFKLEDGGTKFINPEEWETADKKNTR